MAPRISTYMSTATPPVPLKLRFRLGQQEKTMAARDSIDQWDLTDIIDNRRIMRRMGSSGGLREFDGPVALLVTKLTSDLNYANFNNVTVTVRYRRTLVTEE